MRIVKENVFEMLDHSQGAGFLQNRNKDTHRPISSARIPFKPLSAK